MKKLIVLLPVLMFLAVYIYVVAIRIEGPQQPIFLVIGYMPVKTKFPASTAIATSQNHPWPACLPFRNVWDAI